MALASLGLGSVVACSGSESAQMGGAGSIAQQYQGASSSCSNTNGIKSCSLKLTATLTPEEFSQNWDENGFVEKCRSLYSNYRDINSKKNCSGDLTSGLSPGIGGEGSTQVTCDLRGPKIEDENAERFFKSVTLPAAAAPALETQAQELCARPGVSCKVASNACTSSDFSLHIVDLNGELSKSNLSAICYAAIKPQSATWKFKVTYATTANATEGIKICEGFFGGTETESLVAPAPKTENGTGAGAGAGAGAVTAPASPAVPQTPTAEGN
jgi:hypothetical protein